MENERLKGTTTIGLTCRDGTVFASDRRASWGTFIASKAAKKIFQINDSVAASVAGSVGDAISLMRLMQAEASLYEVNTGKMMTANSVSTLLANILQGNKIYPYLVQLLVGGFDGQESKLYTLDPIGGIIEERMAASGSGSPMAYGVLEQEYSEDKTVEENIPLIIKAMDSALRRDTATGDGISLVSVTESGFREYTDEEVKEIYKKVIRK